MSDLSTLLRDDLINAPEYEQFVNTFMDITSKAFRPQDIVDVMSALKQSNMVSRVMEDPSNLPARSCVQLIIKQRPTLNDNFLIQLVRVCTTTIKYDSTFNGAISNTVRINVDNVMPPNAPITRMTALAKQDMLRENINELKLQRISHNYNSIVPTMTRMKMDRELLDNTVNTIVQLNRAICEGNRQNGRTVDGFVAQKLVD